MLSDFPAKRKLPAAQSNHPRPRPRPKIRIVRNPIGALGDGLKKNQLVLGMVVLAALVALVVWGRHRIHFDFGVFRSQLALADWRRIGIATACIYAGYAFRSVRWAMLLRHIKKVHPFS